MRASVWLSAMFAVVSCGVVFAQSPAPVPVTGADQPTQVPVAGDGQELETIVVSGRFPGPGLWKVRNGENLMWILGSQSPLPKRMDWDSANVERRVSQSQVLLMPPTVDFDADVGLLRGLTLLPALFRARKNPDGKTLQEVVSAEQYARWLSLKRRYIGGERDIEEWRPVFAALTLYDKAITRSGMTQQEVVVDTVRKAAKRNRVKITVPTLKLKIRNPKQALRDFSSEELNDQECFRRTLDRIESDLNTMAGRANAWAEGDIETLRSLPYESQFTICGSVFTGSEIARKQGIHDIQAKVRNVWLSAAEKALRENAVSFAVLPVHQMLQPDGLLQQLAAKGYVIEAP